MPELPEVERFRRYVAGTSLDQKIIDLAVEDEKILSTDVDSLRETVLGRTFVKASRVGKFLFLHTDSDQVVMMHFGLTGKPSYFSSLDDPPRFTRAWFGFDSGKYLGFVCMRKFGRIDIDQSVAHYQHRKKLGQDAQQISESDFISSLAGRKTVIKPALLLQKKFAGIGNWIADEMLYQARIHPATRTDQISPEQYASLYKVLQDILQTAIDYEGDYQSFPGHFMVPHRWGDGLCPETGVELSQMKVGGRTTYFNPDLQPMPD